MSENSNISTLVLKNESTITKKKENQYNASFNNTVSIGKNMEAIPEQNEN